jgi:hypothetical protein
MANSYTTIVLTTDAPIVPALTGTDARDKAINVSDIIKRLSAGLINGTFDLMADAVRASGTITIDYSKIAADDTVVIAGTTFTCKASGANGTTQFNKVTNATATAASLVTAINANTTTSKYLSATSALGVVTVTCKQAGTIGNTLALAKTENVTDAITLSAAAMASGTNGTLTTNAFGM